MILVVTNNEIILYLGLALLILLFLILLRIFQRKRTVSRRNQSIAEFSKMKQVEDQTEQITYKTPVPIFDEKKRHTNFGYAYQMNFIFNPKHMKRGFRLKEWDFYQIQHGRYVVQLTIGHVSYAQNVAMTLIDLEEGKTYSTGIIKMFKGRSMNLPTDPSIDNEVHYVDSKLGVDLHYVTKGKDRHLYGSMMGKDKITYTVDIHLERQEDHEAMVINTPFSHSFYHFYLNYKIGNLKASGTFSRGDFALTFDPTRDFGLLDWGRGVWPYDQVWYWGQVNDYLPDGRMIGLNLGYGFGNLEAASENMLFLDGKAYKLGRLYIENDVTKDYMSDWVIKSKDGKIDLVMKTIYDRFNNTDFKLIQMKCHQVYGRYYGKVTLDNGTIIELTGQLGFFERAHNRW